MAFRDHRGQSLQKGDTVAFVFHPAAYFIKLTRGIITDINETRATLWLTDNTSCSTMSSHGVFTKLTKIPGYVPEQDSPLDAAGQPVAMGDTVVFQAPLTMNGCKGFVSGGVVEKLTDKYVFVRNAEGKQVRKMFGGTVVVKSDNHSLPENPVTDPVSAFFAAYDNEKPYLWLMYVGQSGLYFTAETKEGAEKAARAAYNVKYWFPVRELLAKAEYARITEAAAVKMSCMRPMLNEFTVGEYEGEPVVKVKQSEQG